MVCPLCITSATVAAAPIIGVAVSGVVAAKLIVKKADTKMFELFRKHPNKKQIIKIDTIDEKIKKLFGK